MYNIEISHKNKLLSLFHVITCSLNKTFDDLAAPKTINIIAKGETRTTKNQKLL